MKPNTWATMFGAKRRASDRALLASLEREIVEAERAAKAREKAGQTRYPKDEPAPCVSDEERARIARAFGRL